MTQSNDLQKQFESFEKVFWDAIKEALLNNELDPGQIRDAVEFTQNLRKMKDNMMTLEQFCRQ